MSAFETYRLANERMDRLIDLDPVHDRGVEAVRRRAVERFHWMRDFTDFLGNPQLTVPVIHVTGTSGKGSTATAVASILQDAGLRTLLHTSPYLQVSTEKLQIDGQLIAVDELSVLTDEVIDAGQRFRPGELTYGEAWMALVFLAMQRFQPDVTIVEVGAGGRYDVSNVVLPEVAIITTVGIDHTESLGDTIEEIAWHKAGIVKPGVRLVHSVSQPGAVAIIEREARSAGTDDVTHVTSESLGIADTHHSMTWTDPFTGVELLNGIPGAVQRLNGAVAVAAARAFKPDLTIDTIARGLASARIAARFERMPSDQIVVLDGAHNEQKVAALLQDLIELPRPRVAVVGFLATKRFEKMLGLLAPHVDGFVVAEPQVTGKSPTDAHAVADRVRECTGKQATITSSLDEGITQACVEATRTGSVVVTGSLYLCGEAREFWYPSADIVEQLTQWPDDQRPATY